MPGVSCQPSAGASLRIRDGSYSSSSVICFHKYRPNYLCDRLPMPYTTCSICNFRATLNLARRFLAAVGVQKVLSTVVLYLEDCIAPCRYLKKHFVPQEAVGSKYVDNVFPEQLACCLGMHVYK